jgi:membrane associated rhomboid family serine protease
LFLLPLEEDHLTWRPAYTVWALICLNVAAFVAMLVSGSDAWFQQYGYRPDRPSAQSRVTSMFVHGGFLHLLGNMFFLLKFGDNVENMTGGVRFVLAYFLAGAAAVEIHALMTNRPDLPLIGASGAVSGVIGMYLVLFPHVRFHTHIIFLRWRVGGFESSAAVATGAWFGQQLLLGALTSLAGVAIGIAFWAHVGGFVAGVVLGLLSGKFTFASGRGAAHVKPRTRWGDTDCP